MEGRQTIERIIRKFTNLEYEIIDHVAGIRPIIDRSNPSLRYQRGLGWFFNGLGSKGVIYAPATALELLSKISSMI